MIARRVEAGRGWQWLVEGWQLFIKAPAIWVVMLLLYLAVGIVLSFIPVIGGVAEALITPALTAGMLYGAAALASGRLLEIQHLFRAFQDKEKLNPLLILGALLLVGYVIIGLVIMGFAMSWMAGSGMMHNMMKFDETTVMQMLAGMGGLAVVLVLLLMMVITMAMFYAIPLVMLTGEAPLRALQESFSACLLNMAPFLVFGLLYLVLALLAAVPFGLGFLVLGPVTVGAVYASYQDVFTPQQPPQLPPLA